MSWPGWLRYKLQCARLWFSWSILRWWIYEHVPYLFSPATLTRMQEEKLLREFRLRRAWEESEIYRWLYLEGKIRELIRNLTVAMMPASEAAVRALRAFMQAYKERVV